MRGHPRTEREGIIALIGGGGGHTDIKAVASLHLGQRQRRSRGHCKEFEI
jgi:hypothetical protein